MADLWFALFSAGIGLGIATLVAQSRNWAAKLRGPAVFAAQVAAGTVAGIGFVWLVI